MKLIFIYGPHAAGKYTTGAALAELTGYKFFHNHLTVPAADALFVGDETKRSELVSNLRLVGLKAAAKYGLDTIFTFAYSGTVDDPFVAQVVATTESYGGKVFFVQLYAPPETLLQRIGNESRRNMGKISDKVRLQKTLGTRDQYAAVKYKQNLQIDTTKSSPEQSAETIARTWKLAQHTLPS